jgi:subtilisin family serine protease
VVAPGESIPTTYWNDAIDTVQGTSYAAAYVAGVVSLMYAINPNLTSAEVHSIITSTATDLGTAGFDSTYGYGLINAAAAVRKAAVANKLQPCHATGTGTPALTAPVYAWTGLTGETTYRMVVKSSPTGTLLFDTTVTGTTVVSQTNGYTTPLSTGTTYYWYV